MLCFRKQQKGSFWIQPFGNIGIFGQCCWFVQRSIETCFPSSFLLLLFSFSAFLSFIKKDSVPCAIRGYSFLCLPASFTRRGTKMTSGHKHLGKCTPCPLNGFLLGASNTTFVEAGETRKAVLGGRWKTTTGHQISESRTFQMSSRTIGDQDNHFLHLSSRRRRAFPQGRLWLTLWSCLKPSSQPVTWTLNSSCWQ